MFLDTYAQQSNGGFSDFASTSQGQAFSKCNIKGHFFHLT